MSSSGVVVQLVRIPACHAGGRGFESRPLRQYIKKPLSDQRFFYGLLLKGEIHRVLKTGGVAYISEPVFAGDFNEILRLFHDEQKVREAAFASVKRAVEAGRFELASQTFFSTPMHFSDFSEFEAKILKVTHTQHHLSETLYQEVRKKFMRHMTPEGAAFHMPIRVDLIRKVS